MNAGLGNAGVRSSKTPQAPAATVTAANNGTSLSGTTVVLGQAVGAVGDPGALLTAREIPTGGFNTNFKDALGAAGPIVSITSTSVAAAGNTHTGLFINLSGVNSIAAQSTYGMRISNTHSGTTSVNYGMLIDASGGASGNTGINVNASGAPAYGVVATATSWGIYATGGIAGVQGNSNSVAVWGVAGGGGVAVQGNSVNAVTFQAVRSNATTNTVLTIMDLNRDTTGIAANGIGTQITFTIADDLPSGQITNSIISKWSTVAHLTRESTLIITGVSNAVTANILTITGTNQFGITTGSGATDSQIVVDAASNNIYLQTGDPGYAGAIGFLQANITPGGDGLASIYTQDSTGAVSMELRVTKTGVTIVGDTVLLHTGTALADGSAAALGTLTNAPAAGNPSKWIPVDDNGTTRYLPAW
jgi:hypothetical protein